MQRVRRGKFDAQLGNLVLHARTVQGLALSANLPAGKDDCNFFRAHVLWQIADLARNPDELPRESAAVAPTRGVLPISQMSLLEPSRLGFNASEYAIAASEALGAIGQSQDIPDGTNQSNYKASAQGEGCFDSSPLFIPQSGNVKHALHFTNNDTGQCNIGLTTVVRPTTVATAYTHGTSSGTNDDNPIYLGMLYTLFILKSEVNTSQNLETDNYDSPLLQAMKEARDALQ